MRLFLRLPALSSFLWLVPRYPLSSVSNKGRWVWDMVRQMELFAIGWDITQQLPCPTLPLLLGCVLLSATLLLDRPHRPVVLFPP